MQDDLFERPPLPGLVTRAGLVDAGEEAALIAAIDGAGLSPFRFQGWEGKRLTASFGTGYDFERSAATEHFPIPGWLDILRVRAATLAAVAPQDFVQVLLIRYDPGAGIGWHRDRPMFGRVVGVSLGAAAVMRFRRRHASGFDRATLPLTPRDGYLLAGEARDAWEHSIAAISATRWSITFRTLASPGAAAARPA